MAATETPPAPTPGCPICGGRGYFFAHCSQVRDSLIRCHCPDPDAEAVFEDGTPGVLHYGAGRAGTTPAQADLFTPTA